MTKNTTSDGILRWLILIGELVMVNLALGTIYYIYWATEHEVPPHYKRLMVLITLVYALCGIQRKYNIHSRLVRLDQLTRSLFFTLLNFTMLSLIVLWVLYLR